MPTALAVLQTAGLTVTADGDRLRVQPRNRLTDYLRDYIRQHKLQLIASWAAPLKRNRRN